MNIINRVVAVWKFVASYPALTAGVFQVVIIVAAQLGFHLTTGQLASLAGTVAVVFGLLVHIGVIPVSKVANVKAGLKPINAGTAAMLDVPLDGGSLVKPSYVGEHGPETVPKPSATVTLLPTVIGPSVPVETVSGSPKYATDADVRDALGIGPLPEPPREVVHDAITTIEAKPRLGAPIQPNKTRF